MPPKIGIACKSWTYVDDISTFAPLDRGEDNTPTDAINTTRRPRCASLRPRLTELVVDDYDFASVARAPVVTARPLVTMMFVMALEMSRRPVVMIRRRRTVVARVVVIVTIHGRTINHRSRRRAIVMICRIRRIAVPEVEEHLTIIRKRYHGQERTASEDSAQQAT